MAFRNVFVTQHSKISYKMNHAVIQSEEGVTQIPIDDIQLMIISTTRAVITTHAVMEFLKKQIRIVFTDDRQFPIGEINNYLGTKNRNRNLENQINWNNDLKDRLWQQIIKAKITNSINNLKDFDMEHEPLLDLLDKVEIGDANNREAVSARLYFPRFFGEDFTRKDDNHPKNTQLNYGYQILLSNIAREISVNSYLTELGIHHDNYNNEFNLASDLIEPFRFLVDRLVVNMDDQLSLNNKIELLKMLNQEIIFNDQSMTITSAISSYVRDALAYLSGERDDIRIEIQV